MPAIPAEGSCREYEFFLLQIIYKCFFNTKVFPYKRTGDQDPVHFLDSFLIKQKSQMMIVKEKIFL